MTAAILVLNAGSATLKYEILTPRADEPRVGGLVEHIGETGGPADHGIAIKEALAAAQPYDVVAVGHRVVHGGDELTEPTLIDDEVEQAIARWSPLAPLHNPAALAGIRAARSAFSSVPHVAVFDTAFHVTLPPAARTYAIDHATADRYGIRRYGFHGISVSAVSQRAATLIGRPVGELNLIVLHLGNGASATAVHHGQSLDTSMGMTPAEGLVMGSRSGDLDPSITFQLIRAGWDPSTVEDLYLRRGGVLGLCGDQDMRSVVARANGGDETAELALAVYCRRIRHYLGAYLAILDGVDAVIFTAGVGEHSAVVRERVLVGLDHLGVVLDHDANNAATAIISAPTSRVQLFVIHTDEEREIAMQTARRLSLPDW